MYIETFCIPYDSQGYCWYVPPSGTLTSPKPSLRAFQASPWLSCSQTFPSPFLSETSSSSFQKRWDAVKAQRGVGGLYYGQNKFAVLKLCMKRISNCESEAVSTSHSLLPTFFHQHNCKQTASPGLH